MSQLGQVHRLQATVIELVQNTSGLSANINLEDLCMCSPEVTMQIVQSKNSDLKKYIYIFDMKCEIQPASYGAFE